MAMNSARRLAGRLVLIITGVVTVVVWLGLTLLSARPALKFVADVSPQAQFTFSTATTDLMADIAAREVKVKLETFYEVAAAPRNDPRAANLAGIFRRVQGLTTDLLRVYEIRGGESIEVAHFDVLRDFQRVRERREELKVGRKRNVVVVSLGQRRKVLELNRELAVIDDPSIRPGPPTPGAQRRMARLESYKGEEAISSAIRSLLSEGTPRAYFLTGYREVTIQQAVANSYSELAVALTEEGFEIEQWDLARQGDIPEDATIVALMDPSRELPKSDAQQLYRYVKRGGRLFINLSFRNQPPEDNPTLRELGRLCGFEIGTDLVAHLVPDPRMPNVPGRQGPAAQTLKLKLNPVHPATAALVRSRITPEIKVAREIRRAEDPPEGIAVDTSIGRTGPWAWLVPRSGPVSDVDLLARQPRSAFGERCIAAIVDVEADEGERMGHVVLLSGIALLNGGGFTVNRDFGLNLFNWMSSRNELVTVRGTKGRFKRLDIVPQQVERVDQLLIWFVPGGLLGAALFVFFMRRRQ